MNCRQAQRIIERLGGDSVNIRTHHPAVWQHIETCSKCQTLLASYEKLLAVLQEGRLLEPKSDFWEIYRQEVYQRIHLTKTREQQKSKPHWFVLPTFLPKPALVVAILLVIFSAGLLLDVWRLPFWPRRTESLYTNTPDFYLSAYQQMVQQNPLAAELDNPLVWTVEEFSTGEQQ